MEFEDKVDQPDLNVRRTRTANDGENNQNAEDQNENSDREAAQDENQEDRGGNYQSQDHEDQLPQEDPIMQEISSNEEDSVARNVLLRRHLAQLRMIRVSSPSHGITFVSLICSFCILIGSTVLTFMLPTDDNHKLFYEHRVLYEYWTKQPYIDLVTVD